MGLPSARILRTSSAPRSRELARSVGPRFNERRRAGLLLRSSSSGTGGRPSSGECLLRLSDLLVHVAEQMGLRELVRLGWVACWATRISSGIAPTACRRPRPEQCHGFGVLPSGSRRAPARRRAACPPSWRVSARGCSRPRRASLRARELDLEVGVIRIELRAALELPEDRRRALLRELRQSFCASTSEGRWRWARRRRP